MTVAALRERGNDEFRRGDYVTSAASYTEALNLIPLSESRQNAELRTNRAACRIRLGDVDSLKLAIEDAEKAAEACPFYPKARFRAAQALRALSLSNAHALGEHADVLNWRAVCAATAALALGALTDPSATTLYNDIARAVFGDQSRSASEVKVVSAEDSKSLAQLVLVDRVMVIALKAGTYLLPEILGLRRGGVFVALGEVHLIPQHPQHAFLVASGSLVLRGLTIKGHGKRDSQAAIAGHGADTSVVMLDCWVHQWPEVGLLLTNDASGHVHNSHLQGCTKHAMEVRNGASLTMTATNIEECWQGVVAYNGARKVSIADCSMRTCTKEGILVDGNIMNASTRAQARITSDSLPPSMQPSQRISSQMNNESARAKKNAPILSVDLTSCTVENCGNLGLSFDHGVNARVHACTVRQCNPCAVSIKGESHVALSACVIDLGAHEGLRVGYNFDGIVSITHCAFVGPRSRAIIDISVESTSVSQIFGTWTRPLQRNSVTFHAAGTHHVTAAELSKRMAAPTEGQPPALVSKEQARQTLAAAHRPCRRQLAEFTKSYYAIGNTKGYDVLAAAGCTSTSHDPAVLFAAVGDVRNVLATALGFERTSRPEQRLRVVLNDVSAGVLARDVLLLVMAANGVRTEDITNVWGSVTVTADQRVRLDETLRALAYGPLPAWLFLPNGSTAATEASLRDAWKAWLNCTPESIPGATTLHERCVAGQDHVQFFVKHSIGALPSVVGTRKATERFLSAYAKSGSLLPDSNAAQETNTTLREPPSLSSTLYWSSSIFRAVDLAPAVSALGANADLMALLTGTLEPLLTAFRALVNANRVDVALLPGDVLTCLAAADGHQFSNAVDARRLSLAGHFDVIESSNVADYVSLPAVLLVAAPLLRRCGASGAGVVLAQSMMWKTFESVPQAFLEKALGVEPYAWGECAGLQLTDTRVDASNVLRTTWTARQGGSAVPQAMLNNTLARVALYYCRGGGSESPGGDAGLAAPSAGTLAHLLATARRSNAEAELRRLLTLPSVNLHRWELEAALCIEGFDVGDGDCTLFALSFLAQLDHILMVAKQSAPVQLLFINAAGGRSNDVAVDDIWQEVDSFTLDVETGEVRWVFTGVGIDAARKRGLLLAICVCSANRRTRLAPPVPFAEVQATAITASDAGRWRGYA